MKESGAGSFYSDHVGPKLKQWGKASRIESYMGEGIADIWYAITNVQGALELKVEKSGSLYFRKYQLPWLLGMRKHAYHVWVLALLKNDTTATLFNASAFEKVPLRKSGRYTAVYLRDIDDVTWFGELKDPYFWQGLKNHLGSPPLVR
jgi:hypothetical protein